VLIPVDEGPVCYFGSLDLEGEALSAILKERADALPEIRALRTGALFSKEKVERAREAVTRLLKQETARAAGGVRARSSPGGSLVPQVDVALRADPRVSAVRVALRIREAHPYIVRRLEFSGQRRFSDRYYRRHIRLHEGDSFRPEVIEAGLSQLARAGYIRAPRKEDLAVRFDESRHTADLAVHVEEIGRQKISLVGGHAGLGSTAGVVYSVFDLLGGEELLAGHLEGGPDSLQTLLNLTKEAVFGTRVSFGLSVFQNIVRPNLPFNGRRRHLFTSRTAGFTLAVTAPVSQGDTLGLTYGISHASTRYHFDLPADLSGIVNPSLSSSTSAHALGWHWSQASAREHLEADSLISGGWLGGTQNQIRPSADYTRLLPDPLTQGRNTWAVRGAFAGAASLRGDLPLQDRLFAGDDYVRGFRTGELTPYAAVTSQATNGSGTFRAQSPGANLVGAVNAEYRVPVASSTELAGFCDTGSGWLLPNWLGPHRPALVAGTNGDWRASTGVEVRWQIPGVGQTVRVHLSVNPLRLARTLALPDATHFHPPDRLLAVGWALGSPF